MAQGGLFFPLLFNLYVNDIPVSSHHVDLAMYADDTASLSCSARNLSVLERWLREWRITINFFKSNAMLFKTAGWRVSMPQPVQFLGETMQ